MTLREWIKETGVTISLFAKMVKINRSYLHLLMSSGKPPSKKVYDRLDKVTMGQVKSFADQDSSE